MKLESDMYQPIAEYFRKIGYEIKAEIKSADVVAIRADHVLVVEMKLKYNTKLLHQCIERQKMIDDVYMAIVNSKQVEKNIKSIRAITRRLSLGLILLHERESGVFVEILETPDVYELRLDKKKKLKLLEEFNSRSMSLNKGGVTRKAIATAYREKAIKIAALLKTIEGNQLSTRKVRELSGIKNCTLIMSKNHYGFFKKISQGVYGLDLENDKGIENYNLFPEIKDFYEKYYRELNTVESDV